MRPATRVRALQIFKRALELPDESRRDFVREQCRDDDELSRALDRLFSADESPNPALDGRVGPSVADLAQPRPVPTHIGSYEIVREVDSGGMGTVYEAWQERPHRRVALKTLRGRLLTADGLRRFRFEAEVLGSLRHPAIAQVYESGTHLAERETPYIAMEFIPGARHLLDYVEQRGLDRRARIELFLQVADAVHHGHLSGVIHRDLKPSNILVDEAGAPKVIDFGLARAIAPELEGLSRADTQSGQLLGTVQYMSPEQLSGQLERVDLRSDVYALGVVLFQLLSGESPHDLSDLPLAQVARVAAEEEPRHLSVFDPQLRGDLEWIASKAIDQDRDRRYASVSELAADLRRHLAHEPVLAGPPGGWYRARKYVRRHRVALIVGAVFVAGTLGSAVSIWQRTALANTQLEIANEANGFLERMLRSVQPRYALGEDVTLREFVDRAAAELERAPPSRPEVEASVRATLADTYAGVGRRDLADAHRARSFELLRTTLGEEHEHTLAALNAYVENTIELGRLDEAHQLAEAALATATRALGSRHPEAIRARVHCAELLAVRGASERAEAELRSALEAALETPQTSPQLVRDVRTSLFTFLADAGKNEEATEVLRLVIASRPASRSELDPEALADEVNLAAMLVLTGQAEEGLASYEEVLPRMVRVLGETHPRVLAVRADRAKLLVKSGGSADEEVEVLLGALADVRGMETTAHLHAMSSTGFTLLALGRREDAMGVMTDAVESVRRGSSEPTVDYFPMVQTLGTALIQTARYEEAGELLFPASENVAAVMGEDHSVTQRIRHDLAAAWIGLNRKEEARALLDIIIAQNETGDRRDHQTTLLALLNGGGVCRDMGDFERSRTLLTKAVERHERVYGSEHPQTLAARHMLISVRNLLGDVDAADAALEELLRSWRAVNRGSDWRFVQPSIELANVLREVGRWVEAQELYDQVLRQDAAMPPDVLIDLLLDRTRLEIARENWPGAEDELAEAELVTQSPRAAAWRTHAIGHLRGIVALADPARRSEALELLEASHTGLALAFGPDHWRTERCEESIRRALDGE